MLRFLNITACGSVRYSIKCENCSLKIYKYRRCSSDMRDGEFSEIEELVGNAPEEKNWRGILIALLVILIVCGLVVAAVIVVSPKNDKKELGIPFTFDDMFHRDFQPAVFKHKWLGDTEWMVYRTRQGEVMARNAVNNETIRLMDNSTFRLYNTDWFEVSVSRQYVLIAHSIEQVFRYSTTARYLLFDTSAVDPNRRLIPFPNGEAWKERRLQYAGWSPNSAALTFVYENNLYYQADPMMTPNKITHNGDMKIFNGIPDWIYEEEILHSNIAHWWSPDSMMICYATFDDSEVPEFSFPFYGYGSNIYGSLEMIPYPKAGDVRDGINPRVQLWIMDTENTGARRRDLKPPEYLRDKEHYISSVSWSSNEQLLVVWFNRAQNISIVTHCNAITTDCHQNLEEVAEGKRGWIDMESLSTSIMPIDEGQNYLIILPANDGHHGYYRHIAMVSVPWGTEGTRTYLTHGLWDVTSLVAYDKETRYVYFISTNGDPRKRHLFRVPMLDVINDATYIPECLTCEMDEDCQYVSASFSESAKYFVLNCEGPGVPTYMLRSTKDDRNIMLEDNHLLADLIKNKAMPKKEYFEIEVDTDDGQTVSLWALVYLPPELNYKHITQYPLLINTYGGPGTQQVTEQFSISWGTYLASAESIIYARIDGRGTAARGERFMHSIYRKLGTLEVQDQISGARFLRDELQFVDEERIAIWGWSYGGFVTAHAVGHEDSAVFDCGIAVAPVTDWRYYDTVYTERYMGLLSDNPLGYDHANVSKKALNFRGKHFMIVHGTADDNVHFQHSAQFIKSLTQADVDFRIQIYTDKTHSIHGVQSHLYRTMTAFLKNECWEGGSPRIENSDSDASQPSV